MSLQNKSLVIFAILFVSSCFMQLAIDKFFIYPSYVRLENNEAIQNLSRVKEAVNKEIERLDDLCHDWAAWDDTYEFMETGSKDYKDANLNIESFATANVDAVYYLDRDGVLFWGKVYDLAERKEIQLSVFSKESLAKLYVSFGFKFGAKDFDVGSHRRGFVLTERGLLMLAIRPILTSENKGPSKGVIVVGRFLSQSILNKLKNETKVDFSVHTVNSGLPVELKEVVHEIHSSSRFAVKHDDDNLFMYDVVDSVQGEPVFLIEVTFPREITKQGNKIIGYSVIFLVVVGLIILFSTFIMIQVMVLRPMDKLSRHIKRIEDGNYHLRLGMVRGDVVGEVAASFDKMVEKIKLQTEQLENLSAIDGLTGIHNRRIFDETFAREWRRMYGEADYISVIMCDVDFFKLFNDNYGHRLGDQCLRSVAEAIRKSLKRPSDFVARYGGEEFVVLIPNTPPEGVHHLAENIRKCVLALNIKHGKSQVHDCVTLSLGVASLIPTQLFSSSDLLEAADQALYESKSKGRNRVVAKVLG